MDAKSFTRNLINFLIVYAIIFAVLFLIFNGRAFSAQISYIWDSYFNKESAENSFKLPLSSETKSGQPMIYIPKIRISAPIIKTDSLLNKDMQKDLEKGVVLYKNSGYFNEYGAPIIIGHSSAFPWYKGNYGSIFALLNRLSVGDEIIIYDNEKSYSYIVENTSSDSVKKISESLQKYSDSGGKRLILLSCWPIGTDWRRIAVVARLN